MKIRSGAIFLYKESIMEMQSIIFNAGATLNGRALARTGTVVMSGNTIVKQ